MLGDKELAAFLREYGPRAQKEAVALCRRWRVPSTVTPEDVAQEILMGVVIANRQYDAARGMTWKNFVLWNGIYHAKRWIHRQRGAARLSGKSRSRELHRSTQALEAAGQSLEAAGQSLGTYFVTATQDAQVDFLTGVDRLRAMPEGEAFLWALAAGTTSRRDREKFDVLTGDI